MKIWNVYEWIYNKSITANSPVQQHRADLARDSANEYLATLVQLWS